MVISFLTMTNLEEVVVPSDKGQIYPILEIDENTQISSDSAIS
jgi:hypothetical protein